MAQTRRSLLSIAADLTVLGHSVYNRKENLARWGIGSYCTRSLKAGGDPAAGVVIEVEPVAAVLAGQARPSREMGDSQSLVSCVGCWRLARGLGRLGILDLRFEAPRRRRNVFDATKIAHVAHCLLDTAKRQPYDATTAGLGPWIDSFWSWASLLFLKMKGWYSS